MLKNTNIVLNIYTLNYPRGRNILMPSCIQLVMHKVYTCLSKQTSDLTQPHFKAAQGVKTKQIREMWLYIVFFFFF